MTRQRLAQISHEELLHLASIFDVDGTEYNPDDRESLEDDVFEAMEDARQEADQADTHPIRFQQLRYQSMEEVIGSHGNATQEGFEFPESYNVTRINAMLRDPAWVFCYWDIAQGDKARLLKEEAFEGFILRLEELSPTGGDALETTDIPIQLTDKSWYINLLHRPSRYRIHLIAVVGTKEEVLGSSHILRVPYGGISEQLEVIDSFELDAVLVLSGIEHLGVAEMPRIPQRILLNKEGVE